MSEGSYRESRERCENIPSSFEGFNEQVGSWSLKNSKPMGKRTKHMRVPRSQNAIHVL